MAFWLDRFKKDDEDDIWEELRQMLLNPPSEQEIALKKQEEQAKIDAALDRMFPDEEKAQEEPYLKYEELFPQEERGELTGKAVPFGENLSKQFNLDGKLTGMTGIEEMKDSLDFIKEKAGDVFTKENIKKAGGAMLQAASLVPALGGARGAIQGAGMLAKGVGALSKKMAPKLGRKVSQEISESMVNGGISGALEGLGRGLVTDENPWKTAAQDAAAGTTLGALGGVVGGKIAHNKRKANLDELLDKRKDWGIAFTKQTGKPVEAIDKLLEQKQGFVPNATKKRGIGDIDFVWGKHVDIDLLKQKSSGEGLKHIIERRNQQGYNGENFVLGLPKLLKEGKTYSKKGHPGRYYIGGQNKEAAIRTDYDKKPRNWLTSAYYLEETPSQASAGFRTYDQTSADKQFFPLSDLQRSNNIITNSNSNLNPSQQSIQKPSSHNEWLEELKRRHKKLGWW